MLRALQCTAALLVLAFGLWIFGTSSSFKTCKVEQTAANTEQRQENPPSLAFSIADDTAICVRCAGHILYEYREFSTAVATVFIAIFTFTLWQSTKRMMVATQGAVDLARQEFVASHRPKLRIRRITPNRPFLFGVPISIVIEVANIGDTQATIFEVGIDVYANGSDFDAAPRPQPSGPPVPAGKEARMTTTVRQSLSKAQIDAIELGTLELRLLGVINYRDDNGTIRATSFARLYDRTLRRFIKVSEDDQEADREYEN